jgi:hypothetical protein
LHVSFGLIAVAPRERTPPCAGRTTSGIRCSP